MIIKEFARVLDNFDQADTARLGHEVTQHQFKYVMAYARRQAANLTGGATAY